MSNTVGNEPRNQSNIWEQTVELAMKKAMGFSPKPFQLRVASHLIKMKNRSLVLPSPQASLLVQGTGGGKTCVYQTVALLKCGINLIIQNTLTLSSDQMSKVASIKERIPGTHAIQLDAIRNRTAQNDVKKALLGMKNTAHTTVFVFASPESILKPHWLEMFYSLIEKGTLKFICFDEVHLFVSYGISFRPSFIKLRDTILKKILSATTIPTMQHQHC